MNETEHFLSTLPPVKKVTAPSLPSMIVHREALVQRLTEAIIGHASSSSKNPSRYKFILLEAPAGYGKTTLLAEFAQQSSIPCCWYFLDHSDAEPLAFLRILLLSLRQNFPTFGTQLALMLSKVTRPTESSYFYRFLDALVEALAKDIPQRFALFLCNYQEVSAYPEMTSLVEYLLNHLPEQVVLVLESREIPELDFATLLAERAMSGLGRDLLGFSPQEICLLAQIQKSRVLSIDEAEQLARVFDGWITGLLLGTHLGDVQFLQGAWDISLAREKQGVQIHTRTLFSYMVNEIFKYHQQMYAFLQEAAVVQEMTSLLCSDLLGITTTEAGKCLQYLERHGLFVTHREKGEQLVYTCHPVLRDLLCEELQQSKPARFVQLHQRAAELFYASQHYEQAIYHALEAHLDELAIQLIIGSSRQMMEQGHIETLQQWIAFFPKAMVERHPRLLLIQTRAFLLKGNLRMAQPLLEQLVSLLNNPSQEPTISEELPLLQEELALVRALALIQQGEYSQARCLCQQMLEHLSADEVTLRTQAHLSFGTSAQFLGDLTTRITHSQKVLQLWGHHIVNDLTAGGHDSLAEAYSMLGHFALAEHHSRRATACWEQLQNTPGMVHHLIIQAHIRWDQGRFDEAEHFLQQALTLSSSLVYLHRWQGYALVNLGEFYQDQGLYSRSLAPAEEGLALARQLGDLYLLNYALMTLALIYLYMGDTITACLLLSEMHPGETSETSPGSYQHVQRDLALGTVWLYQHRYVEACALLNSTEAAFNMMGARREQLKTLVRLAACHLEQKQLIKAFERLGAVEQILTTVDAYRQRVCTEIQMFPSLKHAIEQRPEGDRLCALLHWETSTRKPVCWKAESDSASSLRTLPPGAVMAQRSVPHIKFLALGEPKVLLNEQPITHWRMARAKELCFYLLASDQPLRKEQILAALWGETDERACRTFYSTIHYLRKALGGEPTITFRAGVYILNLDLVYGEGGVWYDVAAFEEQYTLGKQALAEDAIETARTAFDTMMKLYQGDYVQPFRSNWCTLRREELRHLYLDAHHQLANLAWRNNNLEESVTHWQQILAVDASREEAYYGLMRCYIRQGKRDLALQQYQRCTEALQQEWGIVPGVEIQHFYRQLTEVSSTAAGFF